MVTHLFPLQRESFPFYLCEPLLNKFTSQIEEAIILTHPLHAIHYLGHSAIHSTLSSPLTVVMCFQIMNFMNLYRLG